MRRRKRQITRWVALGLVLVGTVPATAQAEPRPYVLQDQLRQPMELGLSEGKIRALGLLDAEPTAVVSDSDRTIDVNPYTVSGFGVALLVAIAVGIGFAAVWHRRGTRLTPA